MDVRLHLRAPPSEHASAVVKLGESLDKPGAFGALRKVPAPAEWFRTSGSTLWAHDKEVQGISVFAAGVKPVWEDPAHSDGCTVKACGTGPVENYWNAFLGVAYLLGEKGSVLERATGVKLVDKSNKTRTEHRLEIWLAAEPDAAVSKELSDRLKCRVSVAKHTK